RRAPPLVGFLDRLDRSDEPRDEPRESLMAAPGPSGALTGVGAWRRSAPQYDHAASPGGMLRRRSTQGVHVRCGAAHIDREVVGRGARARRRRGSLPPRSGVATAEFGGPYRRA